MRAVHLDILAGTALALILAVPAAAGPETGALIDGSEIDRGGLNAQAPQADALDFRGTLPATTPAIEQAAEPTLPQAIAIDPVVQQVRGLIDSPAFPRLVAREADRDVIDGFYRCTAAPLWFSADGRTPRAAIAVARLRDAGADGLDPRDYPLPDPASAGTPAEAEIRFTAAVLTYARHLMTGRVRFSRVSANIEYRPAFDAQAVLTALASAHDIGQTLDALSPPHPAYRALKHKLAELRHLPLDTRPPRLPAGPVLRVFHDSSAMMTDPRVPKLRALLGVAAEPNLNYDASLAAAVAQFQDKNGIEPTGQLNAVTVEAFNGPRRSRQIDAILTTMERWRWLPRVLGRTHVVVNVPDYTLAVYRNSSPLWRTRVVVGKPSSPTPLLTETMKFITVNPTWNVPPSIIQNELLPVYQTQDPQIFERLGLRVERNRDGSLHVYQPPGERNALGRIQFNFPNKFLVYQHDTPERHLFAQARRAFSHGCMRVQDPSRYAAVLLSYASPKLGLTEVAIAAMFGGPERQIDLQVPVPVHITYQTAFVDEHGKLVLRDDIYGLDARMLSLLRGGDRNGIDLALERPAERPARRQAEAFRPLYPSAGRPIGGESSGRATVFDRVFR